MAELYDHCRLRWNAHEELHAVHAHCAERLEQCRPSEPGAVSELLVPHSRTLTQP